ncbi:MAG: GPW/gp25 family protein [Candidatus Gastranaerophilales bacterium]|nr:GPW/gp25 family protein [Candidatus Gastranaerophilales bacterium]
MTLINEIKSVDWQPKLNEIGSIVEGIEDIDQCIRIILMTPKGSDPHRPDFGSDIFLYLDYPINEAIPNIIREAIDAVNLWEQRIEITNIQSRIDDSQITLSIEWNIKDTNIGSNTEVSLNVAS